MPGQKMPDSGALKLKNGLEPTTDVTKQPKYTVEEIEAMIANIKTKPFTNEEIEGIVKVLLDKIKRGGKVEKTELTETETTSPAEGPIGLTKPFGQDPHSFRLYGNGKIKSDHNLVYPKPGSTDTK